jgi:hypothetical protein
MKHTTEYLFGKKKEEYEPTLSELAILRIADAEALMRELARQRDRTPTEEMSLLIERYQAVAKAREHWKAIFNEE